MPEIAMKITGDDKSAQAALTRLKAEVLSLQSKLQGVGKAGRQSSQDMSSSLIAAAAGYLSVGVAIGAVTKALSMASAAHEQWIANTKEAIGVADRLIPALKPLLSGSGRPATEETMKIIGAAGLRKEDRSWAYGFFDKLEDAMGGDTKGAQREGKEVLDVLRLGDIPKQALDEFGPQAAGFGDVGQFVRQLQVMSQRFKVNSAMMNKLLPAMERIGTPEEGMAVIGTLSSKFAPRKLVSGVDAALEALGPDADKAMQRKFKKIGVTADMPFIQQLEKFAAAGTDTIEEFQAMGAKAAQAQTLSFLVQGLPKIREAIAELSGPAATEGAILGQIAAMEAASPEVRAERERGAIESAFEAETVFGKTAQIQNAEDRRRLISGLALKRMGLEQKWWGSDRIDESGREIFHSMLNPLNWLTTSSAGGISERELAPGFKSSVQDESDRPTFIRFAREAAQELNEAAKNLNNGTRNMNGGTTMVPRGEDK